MNEASLALCKKPIIGLAMWLSSMCVTNQALKDVYVDLSKDKVILDQAIDIPMDERYSLMLLFRPNEEYDPSKPRRTFFSYFCAAPSEKVDAWKIPNQKLALAVEIMRPDGQLVDVNRYEPICDKNSGNSNNIVLGSVEMKRGKYRMVINNQYPVPIDPEGKVQILLVGRGAGYP